MGNGITWSKSTDKEHEALPRKTAGFVHPEWEEILTALQSGEVVRLAYKDDAEKKGLSRSVGRRASMRGFRVEMREGDGFLSVKSLGPKP